VDAGVALQREAGGVSARNGGSGDGSHHEGEREGDGSEDRIGLVRDLLGEFSEGSHGRERSVRVG
jgi:hypothetical protein